MPDYEVKNALETLTRAQEIKADGRMMTAVKIEQKREIKRLRRI